MFSIKELVTNTASLRSYLPSLPREHYRRRRAIRMISNVVIIAIFSVAAAMVITHQSGGKAFSRIPASAKLPRP